MSLPIVYQWLHSLSGLIRYVTEKVTYRIRCVTGKTLNITQQLTAGLPAEMVPVFLTFSARTSANQTQDILDSKMDKRRKVNLLCCFCTLLTTFLYS